MAYPQNTATLIQFLRPGVNPITDYLVSAPGGTITVDSYNGPDTEPTEQELIDAAADLTTVDHSDGLGALTFSDWYAWRGGDPVKTKRMKAMQEFAGNDQLRLLLRIIATMMQQEFQAIKNDSPLPARTIAQIESDFQAAILSGVGDD